jgi:hypothetical protein
MTAVTDGNTVAVPDTASVTTAWRGAATDPVTDTEEATVAQSAPVTPPDGWVTEAVRARRGAEERAAHVLASLTLEYQAKLEWFASGHEDEQVATWLAWNGEPTPARALRHVRGHAADTCEWCASCGSDISAGEPVWWRSREFMQLGGAPYCARCADYKTTLRQLV